jgi:glycosyltransferase involved in cell wall biosynthesis
MQYGIPPHKIKPLICLGFITHGWTRARQLFHPKIRVYLDQFISSCASRWIAWNIPKNCQFFIGMSSFMLESIKYCQKNQIPSVVEHASLHLSDQNRFVADEAIKWGITLSSENFTPNWVIKKENLEFSLCTKIFCVSNLVKSSLIANGVDEKKIFVNYLGVDLSKFKPAPKNISESLIVLQVGGIALAKGVLTLLDAFHRLEGARQLHFAGGGIETSGIQEKIKAMSSPLVTFHGSLGFEELLKTYQMADIFVLASVADGFGLVVAQAMACGLPVIVSENVGAKDIVIDGVNGFIVRAGDSVELANRLQYLQKNPDQRIKMGLAARESVKNGFTWNDYGDRLNAFINDFENL